MGALTGIRVIEFEGWIAGSLLGMLLADQGAEVIRIARPGAPIYDQPCSDMLARGKQSMVLDLSLEEDRDIAKRLVSTADIAIQNLRPGALEKLGVGGEFLRSVNPRLIHINLPGFASDDTMHLGLAATEGIIAAAIGMFNQISMLKPTFGMDPVYSPLALPSIYGAIQGAIACSAALSAREKTGAGALLEVPLAAAAGMAMSSIYMKVEGAPAHYDTPKLPQIVRSLVLPLLHRYWRNSPTRQRRFYAKIQAALPALMSAYPCADGRLIYIFAIDHATLATKLLDALDILEDARTYGFTTANPYDGPVKAPNLATTASLDPKAQGWLRAKISEKLVTRTALEWETLFAELGLPAALVRTTEEWLHWEPLRKSEALLWSGGRREPGHQVWFPGEDAMVIAGPPQRDEHGKKLRAEAMKIGLPTPTLILAASEPWKPLNGVKVLDFSTMVAGPVAARTLAELGAEVIKVESPNPNHGPRLTCWYGIDVNQGKSSVLIDLKAENGRSVAATLVKNADVLLHNFTPEAATRLGLDANIIKRINPDILVCEIAAYAGPKPSDLDGRHGYDPVLQMASGISARYGSIEAPELHGIASCVDNLTGYSAAFGILTALAANLRGNSIRKVSTSLIQAANLIQFPFSAGCRGSAATGQMAMGEDERRKLWRTKDGWIFTAPRGPKQSAAFDNLLSRKEFKNLKSSDAVFLLRRADVPAVSINKLADLHTSFASNAHSIRTVRHQVKNLAVTQLKPCYLRISGTPLPPIPPTQKPGASTVRVMEDLGYDDVFIRSCIASRAVATALSEEFLP
jgi:crotonobetainyl-CoA:carnitine CoA-transferase CaiB-like acyl-CoA transferase